jgi:hypothetical protein
MKTTALILSKKIGLMHKNQFFIMMSENISFQNLANHFFLVKEMNDGKWLVLHDSKKRYSPVLPSSAQIITDNTNNKCQRMIIMDEFIKSIPDESLIYLNE